MSLETCGSCGTRVLPTAEGTCPSCRRPFAPAEALPKNPFAETTTNPYNSPAAPVAARSASNPLFWPALMLLIASILWFVYLLIAVAVLLGPGGVYGQAEDAMIYSMMAISLGAMLIAAATSIAGAVAMLTHRLKWLAWTGCVLALIPMFGPCYGLTIPIAVWCVILLRRPEVNAAFVS